MLYCKKTSLPCAAMEFEAIDLIPGVAFRHLFGGGGAAALAASQRIEMEQLKQAHNAAISALREDSSRNNAFMKEQIKKMEEERKKCKDQQEQIEKLRKQDQLASQKLIAEIEATAKKDRDAQKLAFDTKMSTYEADLKTARDANAGILSKMQKTEDELKALQSSDPAAYEKNEPKFFKLLMKNIGDLEKVKTPKPRVAFVGMTNAGKSSMINALYNVKCKVSPVECTMGVTTVVTTESYEIVDVYGYNDNRPYYTKEQIDKFLALEAAVLLYTGSIQSCERAITLFKATRVRVIVVRSQADKESPEDLVQIESVEGKLAGEYGAAAWIAASIKQPETLQKLLYLIDAVTNGRETAIKVVPQRSEKSTEGPNNTGCEWAIKGAGGGAGGSAAAGLGSSPRAVANAVLPRSACGSGVCNVC